MRSLIIRTTQRNDLGINQVRTAVAGNDGLCGLACARAISFKHAYLAAKRLATSCERRVKPVVAGLVHDMHAALCATSMSASRAWQPQTVRLPRPSVRAI
jgi:hypothetical protein